MSSLARRLYVFAWLALAAVALAYFAFLFKQVNPSGLSFSRYIPSSVSKFISGGEPRSEAGDPAVAQALARMNVEIDRLKADLESSQKENAALKAHLRTFEQTYGPTTAALPAGTQKPRAEPVAPADRSGDKVGKDNIQVMTMPLPSSGFIDELPESPLPIANVASPRRTQFAVELAKGLKAEDVEARWKSLMKRHERLLSKLEPRRLQAKGEATYSLVAGPFDNAASAALMCARLSIARLECASAVFTGEPLATVANR